MLPEYIQSKHNALLTRFRKLGSSVSARREAGEFLCDGPKLWQEAVAHGAEITALIATEEALPPDWQLAKRAALVSPELLKSVSPVDTPQGVLFACRCRDLSLPERLEGSRYLVLDGVQDPGNVGTIWRSADAFCADGILLVGACADPWHPRTVRATMGAVFRCPAYRTEPAALRAVLDACGLPLIGAALQENSCTPQELDLSRAAVAIGSEGRGLSAEMLELCHRTVRIPMNPRCESLNAAQAATVLLWEMYRK